MTDHRKITRSEKGLFFITSFAIALMIVFSAWRQRIDEVPNVKVPAQVAPSPNAYDFYAKAGKAIVPAGLDVAEFHNVKTRYAKPAQKQWLKKNVTPLKLLRQGFNYKCLLPSRRSFFDFRSSSLQFGFAMANILAVESHVKGERGDWMGAAESAVDILRLGHDVAQGELIHFLYAVPICGIGRRELREVLPHLNAAESILVARRLERIIESHVTYANLMRESKYFMQASLIEAMKEKEWRTVDFAKSTSFKGLSERWRLLNTPRRFLFDGYTQYTDAVILRAQMPYNAPAPSPVLPDDIYVRETVTPYETMRWAYARAEAKNTFVLVILALHAYHLEHKNYPRTLNQLVPRYLKKIPADEFGGGEQLRYKPARQNYILYSIGPDGTDDHGRAIVNRKFPKTKRDHFLMQLESTGDFVAGINH